MGSKSTLLLKMPTVDFYVWMPNFDSMTMQNTDKKEFLINEIGLKRIHQKSRPPLRTSTTSPWTATLVAWSTVPDWPWPPWTSSSCMADHRPIFWMSVAVPLQHKSKRLLKSLPVTLRSMLSWSTFSVVSCAAMSSLRVLLLLHKNFNYPHLSWSGYKAHEWTKP